MEISSPKAAEAYLMNEEYQRKNAPKDLQEAAEFFEAMFLNQLMTQSRQASLADDILGSQAGDKYTDMLDQHRSEAMAKHVNLGIADALIRQFGAAETE